MKKIGIAAVVAASIAFTGCATTPNQYGYDPYYNQRNSQAGNVVGGAAIGAGAGAIAGAVIPGVSTVEGAIAGAVLGGVLGAVVNNRQYYRDTRGYCYYVDQYGQPHYDYNVRC